MNNKLYPKIEPYNNYDRKYYLKKLEWENKEKNLNLKLTHEDSFGREENGKKTRR